MHPHMVEQLAKDRERELLREAGPAPGGSFQVAGRRAHRPVNMSAGKVLAVVSVAVFMVSLDMFIVNVAFPQIERGLSGGGLAAVSWVLNAYAIVFAAVMVPAGRFADRWGRRRVFLAGLIVFVAGSVLCGAAGSVGMLVAARAIQALGAAALLPTSLALLLTEFAPAQRATAIGVWAALGGVAAALGPPLGGLLVQVSWRLVFYVNVPVGLVAYFAARRQLRESLDGGQQRPDLSGAVLLTLAVGMLALGLVEAPRWGWPDIRTLGAFAVAVASAAAFWWRCLSHPSPVVDPSLLRVRSFALANITALLFSLSFAAMLLGSVLFLTGIWHETMIAAGLSIAPGPLMAATLAPLVGRLANRLGQRNLATAGLMLFGLGCTWWLWRLTAAPDYAAAFLPGIIITGAGVGLTLPSLATTAAQSLPPARFATGSAVFTMARQIGFVLGVAVLVAVLGAGATADPVGKFERGWLCIIAAAVLGTGAALGIGDTRRATVTPTPATVTVPGERS